MPSFSTNFPDSDILAILGDDIEVIDNNAVTTNLKAVFEFKYLDDELGDRIGIHYPTIEIDNINSPLFQKKYTVNFEGVSYLVINKVPADMGKTLVILRSA